MRKAWMLAVAAALAAAGWARAEAGGGFERRPLLEFFFESAGRLSALKRQLRLSPEQRDRLRSALKSHRAEAAAVFAKVREGRKKVLTAVRADPADEKAIREAVQGMTGPLTEAALLRAKVRREALAVLSPEQRDRLDRALKEAQQAGDEAFEEFSKGER